MYHVGNVKQSTWWTSLCTWIFTCMVPATHKQNVFVIYHDYKCFSQTAKSLRVYVFEEIFSAMMIVEAALHP